MNDVKTILNLLKSGYLVGENPKEKITLEYIISLSNYLGHNIYPINSVTIIPDDKHTFTVSAEKMQENNFNSSLYLRDDKFMTIVIPFNEDIYFQNFVIRIEDLDGNDILESAIGQSWLDNSHYIFMENDNYYSFEIVIPQGIIPQEINIVIENTYE